MSVTPRTATSLLSATLLIVDQEKSQFFRPLSTSFITLFKRQPSIFQSQSPLPPPDHGNLSACRAEPPSPQCLPAFGFLFIFCPHWQIPPCKLVWSVRQTKRGDCNNCLGGKCSETISIYKNKQGSRKDL